MQVAAPEGPLQAALGRGHGRLSSLGDVSRPHHHEGVSAIRSEDAASLVTATTLLGPCWVGPVGWALLTMASVSFLSRLSLQG